MVGPLTRGDKFLRYRGDKCTRHLIHGRLNCWSLRNHLKRLLWCELVQTFLLFWSSTWTLSNLFINKVVTRPLLVS